MQHVPHTGTGCQGRQIGADFVFGCEEGLAEIERDKRAEGGGLTGVSAGFDCLDEARGGEFPASGPLALLQGREDAKERPELGKSADYGRFGDLATDFSDDLGDGEGAFFGQDLIDVERERGDFDGTGGFGGALPALVTAQGEDEREGGGADDEVGNIAGAAEEVQGNGGAFCNQPGDE